MNAAGTVNSAAPMSPEQIGHLRLRIGATPRAIKPSAMKPDESMPSVPARYGIVTTQPVFAIVR